MFRFLELLVIAYLIGSIPTGYIFAKWIKGVDLRTIGSGNIGATNAMRLLGKPLGILILVIDALKGMLCVLFLPRLLVTGFTLWKFSIQDVGVIFGLMAVIGHTFSLYLKFRGGKGVATGLGIFLAAAPLPTIITLVISVTLIVLTRYVSLGSLVGSLILPILIYYFYKHLGFIFWVSVVMAILVYIRHIKNIKRLLQGNENKV